MGQERGLKADSAATCRGKGQRDEGVSVMTVKPDCCRPSQTPQPAVTPRKLEKKSELMSLSFCHQAQSGQGEIGLGYKGKKSMFLTHLSWA